MYVLQKNYFYLMKRKQVSASAGVNEVVSIADKVLMALRRSAKGAMQLDQLGLDYTHEQLLIASDMLLLFNLITVEGESSTLKKCKINADGIVVVNSTGGLNKYLYDLRSTSKK